MSKRTQHYAFLMSVIKHSVVETPFVICCFIHLWHLYCKDSKMAV